MRMKNIFIWISFVIIGIAIMAVPFYFQYQSNHYQKELVQEFQKQINAKNQVVVKKKSLSNTIAIGMIEIPKLKICYPIREGVGNSSIRYTIGHMSDTAKLGSQGNCVLAGHRGGRNGTFFKHLNKLKQDDEVKITDKKGNIHIYEVEKTYVVKSTDYSVKTHANNKTLTLITCEKNKNMRLIVKCKIK